MNLNLYFFYNKVIQCFTTPNFDDHSPEDAAVQLKRSLILNKDDEKIFKSYRCLDMYHLGTFDDSTGEIKTFTEPVKLLDCSEVLGYSIPMKKEEDTIDE